MANHFKSRKAKIIAVEPSAASRTLLVETIRHAGFQDITGVPGVKEAIELMEVETIDWILTPLATGQAINALNLLRLCYTQAELRNTTITLLIDQNEKAYINTAYEHGLTSHFHKPFTKDSLSDELDRFLKIFEKHDWNRTFTAAEYIREYLSEAKLWTERLNFERTLLQAFPSHEELLFHLIEPLVASNQSSQASSVLYQIRNILPQRGKEVDHYEKTFFNSAPIDSSNISAINILNINKALVIDNDDALRSHIVNHLKEMGVSTVVDFDNGQDAFKFVDQHDDIELIIQEWRLPKITGPLFIQKLHEINKQHIPIIILSSLVKKEDLPFIREFGVANLVEKPAEKQVFTKALIWTIQQERVPTEVNMMERKIRNLLRFGSRQEAEKIRQRFNSHPNVSLGKQQMIEAEFHFYDKDYSKTREFCLLAIKNQGDSLQLLTLLGRCLMHLREFELALKCFERANSILPKNIERLCQIAEIKSEMGDFKAADQMIDQAKTIDQNSEMIKETEAKVALNSGESDKARIIMNHVRAIENVVSYMNNQAVAMARCGMVDEGISRYNQTLQSIPEQRQDIKAAVFYNLGLAMVRAEKLAEAKEPLEKAVKIEESAVAKKARSLLNRVQKALKSNSEVKIFAASDISEESAAEEASEQSADYRAALGFVELLPGDFACYQIFSAFEVHGPSQKMLEKLPHFSFRQAIKREVSGGADRMLKHGA
ncbi:MAG: response regulator [Oligoflexus sp.]